MEWCVIICKKSSDTVPHHMSVVVTPFERINGDFPGELKGVDVGYYSISVCGQNFNPRFAPGFHQLLGNTHLFWFFVVTNTTVSLVFTFLWCLNPLVRKNNLQRWDAYKKFFQVQLPFFLVKSLGQENFILIINKMVSERVSRIF